MSEIREVKIAASIIYHPEYYIMHQRTEGIDNGETGKLGIYGGKPEEVDETALDTAIRELEEESGVLLPRSNFVRPDNQTIYVVTEDDDGKKTITEADIFMANIPFDLKSDQFEYGVAMTFRDLRRVKALGSLTSIAAEALTKFVGI